MCDCETMTVLRHATEDDVAKALEGIYIGSGLSNSADLLDFFNQMLTVLSNRRPKQQ